MPELPEVETTRRGLATLVTGKKIRRVLVRERRLRWPIPDELSQYLVGRTVRAVRRRAKYLLIDTSNGTLIIHLGMSGSIRHVAPNTPVRKHDHVDIELDDEICLRYHDPRRFGSMHWTSVSADEHFLLCSLGPEPLGPDFTPDYLYGRSRNRKIAVKNFLMDAHVVVGVGNIYASEALYLSGLSPVRAAGQVSLARYAKLVDSVQQTLKRAIKAGGTTLRDFVSGDGQPGYFGQQLFVYGKAGERCSKCGSEIRVRTIGQRSSYYCPVCQR
jgi:formamidopyrimidine-DNA glycosylase